ncbi:MAG: hypothetical protein ACRDRL_00325, partial [Sciscionella sp.]
MPTDAGTVFSYTATPSRVVFGAGAVSRLTQEVSALDARRVMLISGKGRPQHRSLVRATLGEMLVAEFD